MDSCVIGLVHYNRPTSKILVDMFLHTVLTLFCRQRVLRGRCVSTEAAVCSWHEHQETTLLWWQEHVSYHHHQYDVDTAQCVWWRRYFWNYEGCSISFYQWHSQSSVSGGAQLPPFHFPLSSLPSHYPLPGALPFNPVRGYEGVLL